MNSTMTVGVKSRAIAGTLAVAVTLLSFGGQLSLVEHYAQSAPAINAADYAAMQASRTARRSTCADTAQPGSSGVPVRVGTVAAPMNERA